MSSNPQVISFEIGQTRVSEEKEIGRRKKTIGHDQSWEATTGRENEGDVVHNLVSQRCASEEV